jgi:hypothetical protein
VAGLLGILVLVGCREPTVDPQCHVWQGCCGEPLCGTPEAHEEYVLWLAQIDQCGDCPEPDTAVRDDCVYDAATDTCEFQ